MARPMPEVEPVTIAILGDVLLSAMKVFLVVGAKCASAEILHCNTNASNAADEISAMWVVGRRFVDSRMDV
jgi:hypothetical protein